MEDSTMGISAFVHSSRNRGLGMVLAWIRVRLNSRACTSIPSMCTQHENFAWFNIHHLTDDYSLSTNTDWKGLVNSLSGLLCTSLSSVDVSSTYRPSHSFMSSSALIGIFCVYRRWGGMVYNGAPSQGLS